MKILIACEESQAVCIEFRKLGHEAYSCDLLPCSGGHPEWHLQQDVTELLKEQWDMIIAFPPCTHLTVAGNRYFNIDRYGDKALERIHNQGEAVKFFLLFSNLNCKKIAIENPVGRMNTFYRKPDQIINPYNFGHPVAKKTCLWLKGLQPLKHTLEVVPEIIHSKGKSGGYSGPSWYVKDDNGKILSFNDPRTALVRSKTYSGIAKAMAEQWGDETNIDKQLTLF